jgi:hypothetical protein
MVRQSRGEWCYGESEDDIRDELDRIGALDEYLPDSLGGDGCRCGSNAFRLRVDEHVGAALRICTTCGEELAIGDSDWKLSAAELREHECVCGKNTFEITVGISVYDNSIDVSWLYIVCRCLSCGVIGCLWERRDGIHRLP